MKKTIKPLLLLITGFVTGVAIIALFAFRDEKENNKNTDPEASTLPYQWITPPVPTSFSFAGEKVPLERQEIKEQFDREILYNYYFPQNQLYIMKLANRYFPSIEKQLINNGVPTDFKYLCIAESMLQNATSKAGAVGFWQFMSYTAPGYKLEINSDVDKRYDFEASTKAACLYLKQAYQKFGSWTAAAASYNCGMGGYNNHATFQQTKDYYNLMLPEETSRYIFRILTFKYFIENASKLGYELNEDQLYHPYKTRSVHITESIPNLASFAIEQGTTYKMLRILNPWLRGRKLTVSKGRTYTISLPIKE
jgi:hypothetical protein